MKTVAKPIILAATFAMAAAIPAGAAQQVETKASAEAAEGPNKIICKREPVAGSRLVAKKVCQTAAEWERQRRDDQQAAEKVQAGRWKSN